MHIDNLYKDITIMNNFKQCYALEKIHGSSAHISWKQNQLNFFAGGMKHETFTKIFDFAYLKTIFHQSFKDVDVVIYGESYGGKMQGMSETYGIEPKFIVFDVKIGDTWLNVPNAHDIAKQFCLEFVDYKIINTTLEEIDVERDRPSTQAIRNGCGDNKLREGIVLRPLDEITKSNGKRIIVKHKRDEFMETATKRKVDPEKLKVLEGYNAIADEWVTPMRLEHVLDKIEEPLLRDMSSVRVVIRAMIEDVYREGKDEIVESQGAARAIAHKTTKLFKEHISKV